MSKFKTKKQFLDELVMERQKLEDLLAQIPDKEKLVEVTDGMSVKDFLAHRTEWGRMMIRWYQEAKAGKKPAVPTEKYKWNQLKELNADIHNRYKDMDLQKIESDFKKIHNKLYELIRGMSEKELLEKNVYDFTGVSTLVTYLNSASASHYRSARRHINKWWKERS